MPKTENTPIHSPCPLLGFVAFSGTGKTTLLTSLIPLLRSQGLRLGMIKHAHHTFDIDIPGKDSYELRKAGADTVLIASRQRWALIHETPAQQNDPNLQEMIDALTTVPGSAPDLILVEGFKHVSYPKIELHRPSLGHPLLFPEDEDIIAIVSDTPLSIDNPHLPVLDINTPEDIARFINRYREKAVSI